MPPARKSKSQSKTVPVLFTLGVIGWGFFAIDRLTVSQTDNQQVSKREFRNIQRDKKADEIPFIQEIQNWILKKLTEPDTQNKSTIKNSIPVISEESPSSSNDIKSVESKKSKIIPPGKKMVKLYFYKANASNLKLHSVNREVSQSSRQSMEHAAIRALIEGPTGNEKLMNFLDSFPHKSRLISVKKEKILS